MIKFYKKDYDRIIKNLRYLKCDLCNLQYGCKNNKDCLNCDSFDANYWDNCVYIGDKWIKDFNKVIDIIQNKKGE